MDCVSYCPDKTIPKKCSTNKGREAIIGNLF